MARTRQVSVTSVFTEGAATSPPCSQSRGRGRPCRTHTWQELYFSFISTGLPVCADWFAPSVTSQVFSPS